jgi:hypothetical protein
LPPRPQIKLCCRQSKWPHFAAFVTPCQAAGLAGTALGYCEYRNVSDFCQIIGKYNFSTVT